MFSQKGISQIGFDFGVDFTPEFYDQPDTLAEKVFDKQLNEVLSKMGLDDEHFNGEIVDRFGFWLQFRLLEDSVNILGNKKVGDELRLEAAQWLFSQDDGAMSFRTICRRCNVNPGDMLDAICKIPAVKAGLAKIQH